MGIVFWHVYVYLLSESAVGQSPHCKGLQHIRGAWEVSTEAFLLRVWFLGALWPAARMSVFGGTSLQRVSVWISASVEALAKARAVTYSILLLSYLPEGLARAFRSSAQRRSTVR